MYISNNIAERIKIQSKKSGVTIKKMLEDVGLGFNAMSNMKTSMPKADSLAKIADYLDCSVDYLLGRTDNQCVDTVEEEKKIIDVYRNLNNDGRKAISDYVEYISTKVEYKKSPASQQDVG